jgi:hypothetical protein
MPPPAQSPGEAPDYEQCLLREAADVTGITRDGEGEDRGAKSDAESYPHSTRMARICSERPNGDSARGAMAYVRFVQILYSANATSGPSDPKIKPLS